MVIIFHINQVKSMINGINIIFLIQINKTINYINNIIKKFRLKLVILNIFMIFCLNMPLRPFFSKSPHSIFQKFTFSWSGKCALSYLTGLEAWHFFLNFNPFCDGVGPYAIRREVYRKRIYTSSSCLLARWGTDDDIWHFP